MHPLLKVAVLASALTASALTLAADNYKVLDLAPKDGSFVWSGAPALNIKGQVAGTGILRNGDWHAVVTGPKGKGAKDLGTLPDDQYSQAIGINREGWVVGFSLSQDKFIQLCLVADDAGDKSPCRVRGDMMTTATAINDGGSIVGVGYTKKYKRNQTGFWGNQFMGPGVVPVAVNNKDMVAGTFKGQAFVTDAMALNLRKLGKLDGDSSSATAMDVKGRVVGSVLRSNVPQAFVTDAAGAHMRAIDLGGIASRSQALGISDNGLVVGTFRSLNTGEEIAFLATAPDFTMVDLNTLVVMPGGVTARSALSANGKGQITVKGSISTC